RTVDTIDSCAVGDGFMASLLSGRKPIADLVLSARPGFSPAYLAIAGYYRLRRTAKALRNRARARAHAPNKPVAAAVQVIPVAPAAGPFAETPALHAAAAPGPKADRAA